MTKEVVDLAREDTNLKKVSVNELAGPCPGCGGKDRFHVHLTKRDGRGAWMCRVCHPAEEKGWGDAIEYLRAFRQMSFHEAKEYLQDDLNKLIAHVDQGRREVAPAENKPPQEQWQAKAARYVDQACRRLWSPGGAACLEYLHSRGLQDKTIKAAQLGYVEEEENGEVIPRLVIPWHADGGRYWAINRRDLRNPLPKGAARYKMVAWSNKKAMYGCELVANTRRYLTIVVEGEIDALTIAQEAGDLPINVVATGGAGMPGLKLIARLSRMPLILVANDREERGDKMAQNWLDTFKETARRYKPLAKDANEMLTSGWSVRTWVEAALDMLPVQLPLALDQAPASRREDQAATAPDATSADAGDLCATCGEQVEDKDGAFVVDELGDLYCMRCWNAREQDQPAQPATIEQDAGAAFLDQVRELVNDAGAWPDGYSLRLVNDEFAARIHALPGKPASEPYKPAWLEALPRATCPFRCAQLRAGKNRNQFSVSSRRCNKPARVNGWCEDHQTSSLLLDMGAALDYPRVEIGDTAIGAGIACWEAFAAQAVVAMKAALPRVKRLLDQARKQDQDQAAS